jgi:hypothetical protein
LSTRPSARDTCKRNKETVNMNLRHALIISPEYPRCLSNSTVEEHVIVDSGASACISPYKTDFKIYGPSRMQIKDLSSTNKVTSERLIQWQLEHKNRHTVKIKVFGYHIPAAKVRPLSPQVIINDSGGYAMMTGKGVDINLGNDIELFAKHYHQSNLPLIPLTKIRRDKFSFWNEAFGFTVNDLQDMKNILKDENTNLSISQKEMLLWHQRLSHASIG